MVHVSVSAVGSLSEALALRESFFAHGFGPEVSGVLGVALKAESLYDKAFKAGPRYLSVEELGFVKEIPLDFGALCLHFNPMPSRPLMQQVDDMFDALNHHGIAGKIGGLQINRFMLSADDLSLLKKKLSGVKLGLQFKRAADFVAYEDPPDCALLDRSGGRGVAFDPVPFSAELLSMIAQGKHAAVGVAGGISPDNVYEKLQALAAFLPDNLKRHISVDAESGLRDEADHLSLAKADRYIAEASRFYFDKM